MVAAQGIVSLSAVYGATLVAGLVSLRSPDQPIGDPWFSMLEFLILLTMPLMVALMVAVDSWAPAEAKVFSLIALVFMGLTALLTCSVHFVLLTLRHQAAFSGVAWMPMFLSFKWPSVAYALDILAWDGFFPLSVLFAAPAFSGNGLAGWIRGLLIASGVLAFAGLSGVIVGDMRLRNIGIAGYAVVFPVVALLQAILFRRAGKPRHDES